MNEAITYNEDGTPASFDCVAIEHDINHIIRSSNRVLFLYLGALKKIENLKKKIQQQKIQNEKIARKSK